MSLRKVATLLATHDRVVSCLVNGKQLASYRALNPVNGCPQTLVAPVEVKRVQGEVHLAARARNERETHVLIL